MRKDKSVSGSISTVRWILGLLLGLLVGCGRGPEEDTSETPSEASEVVTVAPDERSPDEVDAENIPLFANEPDMPVVNLANWALKHGLKTPERLSDNRWRLGGAYTEILLTPGDREVALNGQLIWLGYPFITRATAPYVSLKDFEATLRPLLAPKPIWNPNENHILLDPGHGGVDSGSIGSSVYEKDMTLDLALKLATKLRGKGWRVDLTRTEDRSLSLKERIRISNELDPDLFISLHFNSFTDPSVKGIETLIQTPRGLPAFITRGTVDDVDLEFPSNDYDAESFSVAWLVQRSLLLKTRSTDRGVKTSRVMGVLKNQYCPALLIEGGFLSNPDEGAKIARSSYRELIAEAISDALPRRETPEEKPKTLAEN